MVELKWIQKSLFLILLLQFTGANGQRSLFIRVGHDVTLPCENVINDQNKCNRTTWNFSGSTSGTAELIGLGQIRENVGEKSDRLIVMENCSLAIKKVTDEDVGLYACQQFNKSGGKPVSDSPVLLSVVSLTEQKNNDQVTLNCFVSTFGPCTHRVKWLYGSQVVDKENTELRTSESSCSASLHHLKASHHIYTSRFNFLKCEVTDGDKVQLFSFITGPSGEKPGKDSTTTTPTETRTISSSSPTTSNNNLTTNLKDLWWLFIIVALVLVALLIIVVKVVRRQRTKGKKTQMNDDIGLTSNPAETQSAAETSQDTADPEDGVSYASISYTKKSHSKGRVKNKTVDDGDAVMYSTVKAPSIDPSSLYATIK